MSASKAVEYGPGTYSFPRWLFRDARIAQKAQRIVSHIVMPIYRQNPRLGLAIGRFGFGLIARQEFRLYRP